MENDAMFGQLIGKARKTKNKMARHSKQEPSIIVMRWDTRERVIWRNGTVDVARART